MTLAPRPDLAFGVYIHFPFCLHRCPYCDFNLRVVREIPHEAYAEAVLAELEARWRRFEGRRLVSIYFGGGTPGLWEAACIARVIEAIRQRWPLLADPADVALAEAEGGDPIEVTVEINPRAAARPLLDALAQAGVNRLSVGIQSFDEATLGRLGRDHDAARALETMRDAREAGWRRLSFDLLFGGPGHTTDIFAEDLRQAAALDWADHVSAYSLIVEEATRFGKLKAGGKLKEADEAEVVEMLKMCEAGLGEAGWRRYEISSYSRPGREARHNSLYWVGGETMGLGVGAHELAIAPDGVALRREGALRTRDYLRDPVGSARAEERIEAPLHLAERLYLGLRTRYGVSVEQLRGQFGAAAAQGAAQKLAALEDQGYAERSNAQEGGPAYLWAEGERFVPTARGMLFADDVAMEVLPDEA